MNEKKEMHEKWACKNELEIVEQTTKYNRVKGEERMNEWMKRKLEQWNDNVYTKTKH